MTTTYWILATVAYLASCVFAAWLWLRDIPEDELDPNLVGTTGLRACLWPVILVLSIPDGIGWLASKLRKGNDDNA